MHNQTLGPKKVPPRIYLICYCILSFLFDLFLLMRLHSSFFPLSYFFFWRYLRFRWLSYKLYTQHLCSRETIFLYLSFHFFYFTCLLIYFFIIFIFFFIFFVFCIEDYTALARTASNDG